MLGFAAVFCLSVQAVAIEGRAGQIVHNDVEVIALTGVENHSPLTLHGVILGGDAISGQGFTGDGLKLGYGVGVFL